ncbi:SF-assemblin, putative [Hepatocystis sp. ex Piliocolobus tephrosceles]|nr:SF-assemblin, putative [Hepatocystis sp. ex Piliocolobus tephrosceles]
MSETNFIAYDINLNQSKMGDVNFLNDSIFWEDKNSNKFESDNYYQKIKYDLLRIERNINTEVKKRIEANRNIQQLIENTANKMINNVLNKITTKIENISFELDKIIKKCEELEKGISQIKADLPAKIQTDMTNLKKEINDFQIVINKYINNKKKRDNILFGKIENINVYINSKVNCEISYKQEDLLVLKNESDKLLNYYTNEDMNFKNIFIEEMEEIKNALALTIKEREQSDDDIIQAMNKYTSTLQKALQTVIMGNN